MPYIIPNYPTILLTGYPTNSPSIPDEKERPIATHLPVEVIKGEDGALTVLGYMSRANPQWKTFGEREVLLIFQGAHTYISPRWYKHVNVPTWNYRMVHVYGKVRMLAGDDLYAIARRASILDETPSSV